MRKKFYQKSISSLSLPLIVFYNLGQLSHQTGSKVSSGSVLIKKINSSSAAVSEKIYTGRNPNLLC
jgi:hypothetical protein